MPFIRTSTGIAFHFDSSLLEKCNEECNQIRICHTNQLPEILDDLFKLNPNVFTSWLYTREIISKIAYINFPEVLPKDDRS